MTCDNAFELLSAALDGELSPDEKAQLDRHLAQCDGCRALFDDLSAIHDACGSLEAAPPPALKNSILQNLPAREKPAKVIFVHWKRWAAMAAAFVLVSLGAWNLPKTGFSLMPPQAASDRAELAQDTPQTDPADDFDLIPNIANTFDTTLENADVSEDADPAAITGGSIESAAPADPSPAPSPFSGVFSGKSAKVDAATATGAQDEGSAAKKHSLAATEAGGGAAQTYAATSQELEETALFDTITTGVAEASDAASSMFCSARIASPAPTAIADPNEQPAPANGVFDMAASFDDEAIPEPHPEMGEDENVPVNLFKAVVTEENAIVCYCGVLTVQSDIFLKDYAPQAQENGELWYELPSAAFHALINELTDSAVAFDRRTAGADISSSAPTGLVIVLP